MDIPVKTHLDIYSIDEQGELDIDPRKIREFLLGPGPEVVLKARTGIGYIV